jgi:O-antigen ligase
LALALRLAPGPAADVSYLLLAAYALFGRAHAIRALAFSWLFTMISPGLAPPAELAALGRYAVLLAAAASVFLRSGFLIRNLSVRPFTLATLGLGAFIIAHSLAVSPMPDVSILKAVSWTLALATLIAAWLGLNAAQRSASGRELFWFLALVLLLSLPLLATSLGYLRNGRGFQGILNHPQAFGPAIGLLGAWAAARLLGERRPGWWLVALAGASLAAVSLSEARTAGLAMLGGLALSVVLTPVFSGRALLSVAPGLRSPRVWAVLTAVGFALVVFAPLISDAVQNYISKSGRHNVESVLAAYERSRGGLIDRMQENIAAHPVEGIGFGIASDPATMVVQRDPLFGLPVSASIEKGVTPLMVVEELGLIGALLVALWVIALLRGCARGGLAPFAVCITVLLLNLGEATLFSASGFGLLTLILLGWAYSSGQRARHV